MQNNKPKGVFEVSKSRFNQYVTFPKYSTRMKLSNLLLVISPVVQASSKQYNRDKSNYGDVHVAREYLKNKFVSENEQIELNDKKDHFYFFSIHDYNRDHSLDGHELRLALSGYEFEHTKGHESSFVPEAELEEVIDHVLSEDDKDNDGKISWEEYLESQAYHNDFS